MTHCRDADEGDSLQLWRVVVNVLSKQSWAANK